MVHPAKSNSPVSSRPSYTLSFSLAHTMDAFLSVDPIAAQTSDESSEMFPIDEAGQDQGPRCIIA